jgi:hypothetical protein
MQAGTTTNPKSLLNINRSGRLVRSFLFSVPFLFSFLFYCETAMELHYLPDERDEQIYELSKALGRMPLDQRVSVLFACCTPHQLDHIAGILNSYTEWRRDMSERRLARLQ